MDIYQLLMADHRRIREVLDCLAKTGAAEVAIRATLYATLREELIRHVQAEQEVLYAALVAHLGEDSELLLEGMEQQAELLWTLWALDDMPLGDEDWLAQLEVLRSLLEAHIAEEEEVRFEVARRQTTASEARSLAQHARVVKSQEELDVGWLRGREVDDDDRAPWPDDDDAPEQLWAGPRRSIH
jgi:hemerythrin-like domain-containing protein